MVMTIRPLAVDLADKRSHPTTTIRLPTVVSVDKRSHPTTTIRLPTAVSVDKKSLLMEVEAILTVTLRETPDAVQETQVPTVMVRILLTPTGLRSRPPALETTTKPAVVMVDSRAAAKVVAEVMMTRPPLAREDMEHPDEEVEILIAMDRTTAPAATMVDNRAVVEVMTTRRPHYEAQFDILMSI